MCDCCARSVEDGGTNPLFSKFSTREKNIHDVLQMTVTGALSFFSSVPKVTQKLRVLDEVGLGYLRLGQSATTLSGGEAQRVRLAAHLAQRTQERALFLFDEPTTGLHFDDINKLLRAFRKLVDAGHTVLIIEHNMDVIKTADWIIDSGSGRGPGRGPYRRGRHAGKSNEESSILYGTVSGALSRPKEDAGRRRPVRQITVLREDYFSRVLGWPCFFKAPKARQQDRTRWVCYSYWQPYA